VKDGSAWFAPTCSADTARGGGPIGGRAGSPANIDEPGGARDWPRAVSTLPSRRVCIDLLTMTRFCTVRLAWGLILLIAPDRVLAVAGSGGDPRRARWVARLLGLRHIAQAAYTARHGDARAAEVGAAVDALHGLSMAGLALRAGAARRPAALNAAGASAWTLAGLREARRLRGG
jgi:hypothetical protein